MLFKSTEEIKRYVLAKCQVAVAEAQDKVYRVIDSFLNNFYDEFTPAEYIRTHQLLHSLVKSDVKSTSDGFVAEVYFDASALNYEQGLMPLRHTPEHGEYGWATWTGDKVLEAAMHGSHGGYKRGTAIWDRSLSILNTQAIDILKHSLISNGIPIK